MFWNVSTVESHVGCPSSPRARRCVSSWENPCTVQTLWECTLLEYYVTVHRRCSHLYDFKWKHWLSIYSCDMWANLSYHKYRQCFNQCLPTNPMVYLKSLNFLHFFKRSQRHDVYQCCKCYKWKVGWCLYSLFLSYVEMIYDRPLITWKEHVFCIRLHWSPPAPDPNTCTEMDVGNVCKCDLLFAQLLSESRVKLHWHWSDPGCCRGSVIASHQPPWARPRSKVRRSQWHKKKNYKKPKLISCASASWL